MKPQYIPVVIAAWLIAAGAVIIPRFINVLSTNTTLGDIANGIMGLQNAIYTAMGIEIGVLVTVMALFLSKKEHG